MIIANTHLLIYRTLLHEAISIKQTGVLPYNLFKKKKKKNVKKYSRLTGIKKICEMIGLLYLHTGCVRYS